VGILYYNVVQCYYVKPLQSNCLPIEWAFIATIGLCTALKGWCCPGGDCWQVSAALGLFRQIQKLKEPGC
jgi:hypothetical protein